MLRFFLGLGIGFVLTIWSFGLGGIGHGTYAPTVFTCPLIALIPNWGAWPALLLGPFLWAAYFQYLPSLRRKRTRLWFTIALMSIHLFAGTWLMLDDQEFSGMVFFGLVLATTMVCLLYLVARGVRSEFQN